MITVALLLFNREQYIAQSLEALLRHASRDCEVLIIDNHSTDKSHQIAYEITRNVKNVKLIRLQHPSCPVNSFQSALMYAQNPYVIVTHDDDLMTFNYVNVCLEILNTHNNIGLIGSNVSLLDESGNELADKLYSDQVLERDILIRKQQYVNFYEQQKLWIPTTTHCINRRLYFDYYGNNLTSHSLLRPRLIPQDAPRSEMLGLHEPEYTYRPSGDIQMVMAINEKSDLYLCSKPMFSYRQHAGQQSRIVDQANPMIDISSDIVKDSYFSRNTQKMMEYVRFKYGIQKALFNNDKPLLKSILVSNERLKSSLAALISELAFNEKVEKGKFKNQVSEHIYTRLRCTNINTKILENAYIIFIGSMLLSYILKLKLESSGLTVSAVIDKAPARQGAYLDNLLILSYEQFRDEILSNYLGSDRKVVFVSTSERQNDKAVAAYVDKFLYASKHKYSSVIYTWETLLV